MQPYDCCWHTAFFCYANDLAFYFANVVTQSKLLKLTGENVNLAVLTLLELTSNSYQGEISLLKGFLSK